MKKLLAILVVAAMAFSMLSMTTILSAATADIVNQAGEGTAVVDGVKDEAYDTATPLDFVQKGKTNGSSEVLDSPIGQAWVINDAENVYVFFSVLDEELDNTSSDNYQRDSIDVFWMNNNEKQQWRICYDGTGSADTGVAPDGYFTVVTTDTGYDVELYFPITDVLNNQIEMCLQINACHGGARDYTCYILGNQDADDAYQRTNRQALNYDNWWTLQLTGEHEDTRVDPVEEPAEITLKNYAVIRDNAGAFVQLYCQDKVSWGWHGIGTGSSVTLGNAVTPEGFTGLFAPVYAFTAEETSDWTVEPIFALQIGDNNYLEPSVKNDDGTWKDSGTIGDSARYKFSYSDIVIKANGYNDVTVPAGEVSGRWTAKSEGGYTSGTAFTVDLIGPAKEQLGLDTEGACTWLANVTDVNVTVTYLEHEMLTIEDINAFEEGIPALEQAFIDNDLAEYTERVNNALTAAQAEGATVEDIQAALDDATKATNRARTEATNAGFVGSSITYADETLGGIVAQIQELLDAANAAAAPEPEPEAAPEAAPEENAPEASAPVTSSESGSNVGLIVGIVIVVIVIVVVVVIVLTKKKK